MHMKIVCVRVCSHRLCLDGVCILIRNPPPKYFAEMVYSGLCLVGRERPAEICEICRVQNPLHVAYRVRVCHVELG